MQVCKTDKDELHARLRRLEVQNRSIKVAFITIVILAGAGMLFGDMVGTEQRLAASGKDTLEARTIVIRDEDGRTKIAMGATRNGAAIQMFDEKGTIRLSFGCTDRGPDMILADEKQNPRISMQLVNDTPELVMKRRDRSPLWKAP